MNLAFKATDLFQSLRTLHNVVNRWAGGRWKHVTPILPKKQQKLKCLPIWIPVTSCLIWRLTLVWEYIIPNSRITFLWSLKKVNNMDLSPTLIFECLLYTDKKNLVGLTQRSMRTITYICLFFFHQISRIVRRHIGCFACTSLNTLTQWRSNDYRKQKNKSLICQKREIHPKWTVLFSLKNLGYSTVTVVSFWK